MSRLMWVKDDYAWLTWEIMSIAKRHAQGASFRCWRAAMRYPRWPVQRLRMSRCLSPKSTP